MELRELRREAVAFGPERTLEQDPLFSFRIMVDIALKALSPAINDPTTATLAVDQIHRLLRVVGRRRLSGEILTDGLGQPRVIYHTPNLAHQGRRERARIAPLLERILPGLRGIRHGPAGKGQDARRRRFERGQCNKCSTPPKARAPS